MSSVKMETVEMHTCGEPVRILTSGLPEVHGSTILDKIKYIRENHDLVRKLLLHEPRGHADMYGVLQVQPDVLGAAMGCVFIHNEGYSTMCGHAVVSLGRFAIDHGLVENPTSPETRMVLQCPCGPVETFVEYNNGKTGSVRFNSVPSFVHDLDFEVDVPGYGTVTLDVCYGGAFYAILPAARLGLDVDKTPVKELMLAADAVKGAVKKSRTLVHPEEDDLAFLYGTIFTDGNDVFGSDVTSTICVFADKQVDRSPCGSGTTARIAQQFARGLIQLGQKRTFRGPAGGTFTAQAVRQVTYGCYDNAVVVEVSGKGHYTGTCTFTLEDDDVIGKGFLVR